MAVRRLEKVGECPFFFSVFIYELGQAVIHELKVYQLPISTFALTLLNMSFVAKPRLMHACMLAYRVLSALKRTHH